MKKTWKKTENKVKRQRHVFPVVKSLRHVHICGVCCSIEKRHASSGESKGKLTRFFRLFASSIPQSIYIKKNKKIKKIEKCAARQA
jgi:hypothetical protein